MAGDSHLGVEWHIVPELCRPAKTEREKKTNRINILTRLQGPLNTRTNWFITAKWSINILQGHLVSKAEFSFIFYVNHFMTSHTVIIFSALNNKAFLHKFTTLLAFHICASVQVQVHTTLKIYFILSSNNKHIPWVDKYTRQ